MYVANREAGPKMRTLIVWLLIAAAAWTGWRHVFSPEPMPPTPVAAMRTTAPASNRVLPAPAPTFRCDGRQHCSQMRSCQEATFFIRNCPGTKMDGDNDGVPCESQWCGSK